MAPKRARPQTPAGDGNNHSKILKALDSIDLFSVQNSSPSDSPPDVHSDETVLSSSPSDATLDIRSGDGNSLSEVTSTSSQGNNHSKMLKAIDTAVTLSVLSSSPSDPAPDGSDSSQDAETRSDSPDVLFAEVVG